MNRFFLAVITVLISVSAFSQEDQTIKNGIKINVIPVFAGFYEFQYERVVNEKGSIRIGFGTGTLRNKSGRDADKDFMDAFGTNSFNNNNEHIVKGYTVNADYRYFFGNNPAPKGLYVSPGIQYLKLKETYTYVNSENTPLTLIENDYSIFNIRGMFGYQFIISNTVLINPYLGGGIALGNVDDPQSRTNAFGTGFTISFGVDVGIGF